jgi:hypothetical protein
MLSANELVSRLAPVDSYQHIRKDSSPSRGIRIEQQLDLEEDGRPTSQLSSRHIVLIDLRYVYKYASSTQSNRSIFYLKTIKDHRKMPKKVVAVLFRKQLQ